MWAKGRRLREALRSLHSAIVARQACLSGLVVMNSPVALQNRREIVRLRRLDLLAILCCVVSTCSVLACGSDLRESFYHSLADARRDGAIDRGWIPDFLPESSHNIRELHEVSGGRTWCAFEFAPTDWELFQRNLTRGSEAPVNRVSAPRVPWWPRVLTGDIDSEQIRRVGLQLYSLARPGNAEVILFAIDLPKGQAFFHRVPR